MKGQFYHSVLALLPQLEHSLRIAYTAVNHLDVSVAIADSASLFTTLDVVLDHYLPNGNPNRLHAILGYEI